MKKLVLAILLIAGLQIQSQTTIEEYNYLTKGYPESIVKGMDLKQGYTLTKINEKEWSNMQLAIYSFAENGKTKAYLLTKQIVGKQKIKYYCMPINNEELFNKYRYETSNEKEEHIFKSILASLLVDSLQNCIKK
jgi:hypothetical protein